MEGDVSQLQKFFMAVIAATCATPFLALMLFGTPTDKGEDE